MSKKEKSGLEVAVNEYLKSDKRSLHDGGASWWFLILAIFFLGNTIFGFLILFFSLNTDISNVKIISNILMTLGSLAFALNFYYIQKTPPKSNRDIWLWNKGRLTLVLTFLGGMSSFIALMLGGELADKTYLQIFSVITLELVSICIVFISIYITKNPKYVIQGGISQIATFLFYIAIIFLPLILLRSPEKSLVSQLIIFSCLYFTALFAFNESSSKLNIIQKSIIRFMRPDILLEVFITNNQKIKDEIQALKILKRLDQKDKFGVEKVILTKLAEKYGDSGSKKKNIFVTIVIFTVVAIVSTFIQLFVQDTVYTPLLKEYVCRLFNCGG